MLMKDRAFSQQLVELCDICLIEGVVVKWNVKTPNEKDIEISNSLKGQGNLSEIDNTELTERFVNLIQEGNLALVQLDGKTTVFGIDTVINENLEKLRVVDDIEDVIVNSVQTI